MEHKNAIDCLKDYTGLSLCKNKKVLDVWGELGDWKLMWYVASNCLKGVVGALRAAIMVSVSHYSPVVRWKSGQYWSIFLVQIMKWWHSFLYCSSAKVCIHTHKTNQLDMKEGHIHIWNVSIKNTYYIYNSGLIHVAFSIKLHSPVRKTLCRNSGNIRTWFCRELIVVNYSLRKNSRFHIYNAIIIKKKISLWPLKSLILALWLFCY